MGRKQARAREFFHLCIAGLMFLSLWSCATLEDTRINIRGKVEAYQSLHRGRALLAHGDYEGASSENLKVISLAIHKPPEDEALFNMGRIYAHPGNPKKEYGKSIYFFKKLLEDFPESRWSEQAKIWVGMLQENVKLNQTIETIEQINLKLNQRIETFHEMEGKSKQADGKIKERKEALESLLNSQKLLAQGNFEGALMENQRALSLSGQDPPGDEALFNLGLICAHPGNPKRDYAKSLTFFKKLIKDYPQSPRVEQGKIWTGMLQENEKLNQTIQKLYQVIEESKLVDIEIEERKKEKGK